MASKLVMPKQISVNPIMHYSCIGCLQKIQLVQVLFQESSLIKITEEMVLYSNVKSEVV